MLGRKRPCAVRYISAVFVERFNSADKPGDRLARIALLEVVDHLGRARMLDGNPETVHGIGGKNNGFASLERFDRFRKSIAHVLSLPRVNEASQRRTVPFSLARRFSGQRASRQPPHS